MILNLFGLGYPSKDEMFKFFNETNRKSEGGNLEAIPDDKDLNSLRKMICTFSESPKSVITIPSEFIKIFSGLISR